VANQRLAGWWLTAVPQRQERSWAGAWFARTGFTANDDDLVRRERCDMSSRRLAQRATRKGDGQETRWKQRWETKENQQSKLLIIGDSATQDSPDEFRRQCACRRQTPLRSCLFFLFAVKMQRQSTACCRRFTGPSEQRAMSTVFASPLFLVPLAPYI
jgi:hypothetical protein